MHYLKFFWFFFFLSREKCFKYIVVAQFYITEAENEYVIKGNSAVMKCKIPSFVADYVSVEAWVNVEDGTELTYETDGKYG